MPYKIISEGRGYVVYNPKTHKQYSNKPLSKKMAQKQRVAIIISEHANEDKNIQEYRL
jgi:hypothetical protein